MVIHKCLKCKKTFESPSKLNRHLNKKTPCDSPKKDYKCITCNVKFISPAQQKIHENTKKHIGNISIAGNNNMVNSTNNSYNNIIHLTLNTNSFINTDMSYIGRGIINDIGQIYLDILEKKYFSNNERCILLFDEVLHILEKLHFNIGVEENHNLKILLVFPALKNSIYENLFLEIDNTTKHISWRSVNYETLINNILDHLLILNERVKNENFINFVNFLKKYLIDDTDSAEELEPIINKKLSQMYVNFNIKQNKPDRDVKFSFNEKLQEYINYRNNETTLINGFAPEIVDSKF
jgi:DNA-directed RNA polymerase subunit RPC12/RpoP